jgi:hypothetical protein
MPCQGSDRVSVRGARPAASAAAACCIHAWSPELDALLAGYAIPGLAPPADLASGWLSLWTTVLDGGCSDPASWNPTTVAWI